MSYSLKLTDGDLTQQGSQLGIVYGTDKLTQDMTIWLSERFGGDKMHREFGSMLDAWIGTIITAATQSQVQSEVLRVLQNYQSVTLRGIRTVPQKYSLSEILYTISDISVNITYDTVNVAVTVATPPPNSQILTINASSSTNG